MSGLVKGDWWCHWPMAWYLGDIVVGWCNTKISASNSQVACGINFGETITIPFLIDERLTWEKKINKNHKYIIFFFKFFTFLPICPSQTFFRENDAVCPPRTSLTGILLRWMDLTAMGSNEPIGSGPNSRMSFSRINPRNVVPETTVPTPCAKERSKQLWSFKWKLDPVVTDLDLKPLFLTPLHTYTVFFGLSKYNFLPVQSRCRRFGTPQARPSYRSSWKTAGSGTSSVNPCSPPSRWRSGKSDTSCRQKTSEETERTVKNKTHYSWKRLNVKTNDVLMVWTLQQQVLVLHPLN